MHQLNGPAIQRADRFLRQRLRPLMQQPLHPFAVEATDAVFEPMPYDKAVALPRTPFQIGSPWGPPWHTVWFRLTSTIPTEAAGQPLVAVVDLGFSGWSDGFQAEGLAYRDGRIVHAVQPDRRVVALGPGDPAEPIELWIEAAANPSMAADPTLVHLPTPMGDPATSGGLPYYVFRQASLAIDHPQTRRLATTFHALVDLAIDLGECAQRDRLLPVLEESMAAFDVNDPEGTAPAALAALAPAFANGAAPGSHRIVAVGHAHLDTAWLWPTRETRRKAVRTFANSVDLLHRFPQHRFAHSQAQHYAWVEEDQPELFAEVQRLVAEDRWEPVGGMWVEADLNLPSGESLVRQFVHGQRAFTDWFGRPCPGAFMPDDFGYPAQVPQLARLAGCAWFFTQKLSWNDTNRFPHHTFWWEGLDGSRLFTHFSPVETYNATNAPAQLRFAARNFADHRGASTSLVCFGHGDGGGGPTVAMIERAQLAADWEGVPPVSIGSVDGFFSESVAEYGERAPVWAGEMYLEYHRGTYTSQARTKQGNARCERLLYEAELWSASAGVWPGDRLDALWKAVLTQQFHDIIPGSSIAWAHHDAERVHAEVAEEAQALIDAALAALPTPADGVDAVAVLNPSPFSFSGVVASEEEIGWADVPAQGIAAFGVKKGELRVLQPVVVDGLTLDNGLLHVQFNEDGDLVSLRLARNGREVLPPGVVGGRLVLHRDQPAHYDAWDIDLADTLRPRPVVGDVSVEVDDDAAPLRASVIVSRRFGRSSYTLTYTLDANVTRLDCALDIDWQEDEQRLQVVLPIDVHAREALCGTQFGSVTRPRHANTSWDAAKFEVCAHRYVHAGEPGFGVAILAPGPHGYDVRGDALRMTLLKSSNYPDPHGDRGAQRVEWSYWVHDGLDALSAGVEREAASRVHPPRLVSGVGPAAPLVSHTVPGAVIEAVKRADDGSGDLVVRLWESNGARTAGELRVAGGVRAAWAVDLLEAEVGDLPIEGDAVAVELRPFQVLTVRIRP